mgnify:CR=1 FL=1
MTEQKQYSKCYICKRFDNSVNKIIKIQVDDVKEEEKVNSKSILVCKDCKQNECCVYCDYWCGQSVCRFCRNGF